MKELICIVCPRGCHITVDDNLNVTGNSCPRGKKYAIQEITNPQRVVTSTVKLINSSLQRLPVKSEDSIPKEKIFDVMKEINKITISSPVEMNQVIIENVLGLGVNIISTRKVEN